MLRSEALWRRDRDCGEVFHCARLLPQLDATPIALAEPANLLPIISALAPLLLEKSVAGDLRNVCNQANPRRQTIRQNKSSRDSAKYETAADPPLRLRIRATSRVRARRPTQGRATPLLPKFSRLHRCHVRDLSPKNRERAGRIDGTSRSGRSISTPPPIARPVAEGNACR